MYWFNSLPLVSEVLGEGYASLATYIPLVLVVTVVVLMLCFNKRTLALDKLHPPGPSGIPFLGYLPFLGSSPHLTFKKLSGSYGPIVRVKLGSKNVVVMNDLNSIKEGLNKDEVLGRPQDFLFRSVGLDGIFTINGQPWLENRRFCMHILRDLGFGKKSMEEHIKEEIVQLCEVLKSWNRSPRCVSELLTSSVSNNITALVFGERYDYNDPRRLFLDETASRISRYGNFNSVMDFLPTLRKLLFYIPSSRYSKFKDAVDGALDFIRKEAEERSKILKPDVNRDFIDAYLKKISESQGGNSSFSMRILTGSASNFFGAGTNTVKASLEWHLLNFARDPEGVQRKLQQEVDDVVGRSRAPEWEDRHRMPYTMAVIWEMLRWRTTTPLGVVRAVDRDTYIGGFHLPSGTLVQANFWAVHHDPEVWRRPLEFDPTRFLNEKHTELLPKPAALIPFSSGRRMCPGETLALMEIFLYLTTLLQTFTILPKEGNTISMEAYDGLTCIPLHSQELTFTPR